LYLESLYLQDLRCFENKHLEFDAKITLIEGCNGSGKTTIIEALYYLCYLRSFRTNLTQELIRFDQASFFIKAGLVSKSTANSHVQTTLQAGFSVNQRIVKLNDQPINSFKELINNYRVVVLTADDLAIIQGGPEARRSFIDQYIYLQDPSWSLQVRNYQRILDHRNALLKSQGFSLEHYQLWTKQLIASSDQIRIRRKQALGQLQFEINQILINYFQSELVVDLAYQAREWQPDLQIKEQVMQRTLFGAHLDDYQIKLSSHSSRKFASRGQQKLLAILFKIIQVMVLKRQFNGAILFLLDDFVTDLDRHRSVILFDLLASLEVQLVFTAPNLQLSHQNWLISHQAKVISI